MEILIDKTRHIIPFDLSNITIGEYVEYYDLYGRALDDKLKEIVERDYSKQIGDEEMQFLNKEIDVQNHMDQEALSWIAFWSKSDITVLKSSKSIEPLLYQYRVMRFQIKDQEEQAKVFPQFIDWNDEQWEIQDFVVDPASGMTFNEVITSKEVIRQLASLGKGRWDSLPYLCCIFLRKKGEPFKDGFIQDTGERMKLMQTLPLNHALTVGFFLSICVNSWETTFQFSAPAEEAETPNLSLLPTTNNGDG